MKTRENHKQYKKDGKSWEIKNIQTKNKKVIEKVWNFIKYKDRSKISENCKLNNKEPYKI